MTAHRFCYNNVVRPLHGPSSGRSSTACSGRFSHDKQPKRCRYDLASHKFAHVLGPLGQPLLALPSIQLLYRRQPCRAVLQQDVVPPQVATSSPPAKPVYKNANFPTTPEGRTYHLGTKVGARVGGRHAGRRTGRGRGHPPCMLHGTVSPWARTCVFSFWARPASATGSTCGPRQFACRLCMLPSWQKSSTVHHDRAPCMRWPKL